MRLTTEAAIEFRLLFVFPLQSHLSATRRTRRHWVPLQLLLRDVNDSMNQGNNVCATEQSLSETPNTGRLYCRLRLNTRYFFHSFRGRHSRRSAPVYTRSPASSTVTPPSFTTSIIPSHRLFVLPSRRPLRLLSTSSIFSSAQVQTTKKNVTLKTN